MLPMIFRKVDLWYEKLRQWRKKWADVLKSLPQLQIGLSESWKLVLPYLHFNLPNLNLVNNTTPLGLWQFKSALPEGSWSSKVFSWRYTSLEYELGIFRSSLFHSITTEGKKEFWKKLCFTLSRGILLVFLALYVLTEVDICIWKQQFLVPSSFLVGFQT